MGTDLERFLVSFVLLKSSSSIFSTIPTKLLRRLPVAVFSSTYLSEGGVDDFRPFGLSFISFKIGDIFSTPMKQEAVRSTRGPFGRWNFVPSTKQSIMYLISPPILMPRGQ